MVGLCDHLVVLLRNSGPVVGDLNHTGPVFLKAHVNGRCAGVQGVLDEFLDNGTHVQYDLRAGYTLYIRPRE